MVNAEFAYPFTPGCWRESPNNNDNDDDDDNKNNNYYCYYYYNCNKLINVNREFLVKYVYLLT